MTERGFVLVHQDVFHQLRRHCERCENFNGSLGLSADGQVALVPTQHHDLRNRRSPADAARTWFLRNAPTASRWRARQIELGLQTTEQYECIVRAFGNVMDIRVVATQIGMNSENRLIDLAERLALLTRQSLSNVRLLRSFAYFQALILLSYCQVLRKHNVSFPDIDRIIGHIAANEKDRKKILKGALWVNATIHKLVDSGWTVYRATELFFINALSLSYLGTICQKNNVSSILSHLGSTAFVGHEYSDCLGPRFTIPGLINSLLRTCEITAREFSVEQVCTALGYELDQISDSIEDHYKVHAAQGEGVETQYNIMILSPSAFETPPFFHSRPQSVTSIRLPVDTTDDILNYETSNMLNTGPQALIETRPLADYAYKRSVMLRSKGLIAESDEVISEFLNSQTCSSDNEFRLLCGRLSLSEAYNRVYQFDFVKAHTVSCSWQPSSEVLSDDELHFLCDQLRVSGRILMGEGRFTEAMSCFAGYLTASGLPQSHRTVVICHLSDVYCEVAYQEDIGSISNQYLVQGRRMIEHEIEHERTKDQRSKSLKRLLLSLIEIEIRQGYVDKARVLLSELLSIYCTIVQPNIDDKLGHVRALISKARVSETYEAEDNWTAALLQNKFYNPFEEEVFTCSVIYLFISLLRFRVGDIGGSQDMFQKAAEVIRRKKPQFLIPGLGTYVFDFVKLELELVAGLVLPEIAYL